MEKIKYYRQAIFSPERYIVWMSRHGWLNWMSDRTFIKLLYRIKFGHKLRLNSPETYNEKIQWLKLYDRNPQYTQLVDKVVIKDYVAKIIGEEYIIPTLGVWENADDIDFSSLPEQFVLKCNHDSHDIIICRNKEELNPEAARAALKKGLKRNYYKLYREWAYKDVPRRILAEKLIADDASPDLNDYKFYCFNGKALYFKIDSNRSSQHIASYFDEAGRLLPYGKKSSRPSPSDAVPSIPKETEQMKSLAETIARELTFARIDFYDANRKIYFGEITLYPGGGFSPFTDEKWDYEWGEKIQLPNKDSLWKK